MQEKKKIESINKINDDILELSVCGTTKGFSVRKSLLCSVPESALEAMFSGRHPLKKLNGKVYLDRDPNIFKLLLNYLRNGLRYP